MTLNQHFVSALFANVLAGLIVYMIVTRVLHDRKGNYDG